MSHPAKDANADERKIEPVTLLGIIGDHSKCKRCCFTGAYENDTAKSVALLECERLTAIQAPWLCAIWLRQLRCRYCWKTSSGVLVPLEIQTHRTQCQPCDTALAGPEPCRCTTEFTVACTHCNWKLTKQYHGFAVDKQTFIDFVQKCESMTKAVID